MECKLRRRYCSLRVQKRAYKELVRMGMSDKEGFSIKTFMKYYRK